MKLLLFSLAIIVSVAHAKPKTEEIPTFFNDGYFKTADCTKYIASMSQQEQDDTLALVNPIVINDVIAFLTGSSSFLAIWQDRLTEAGNAYDKDLLAAQSLLKGRPYHPEFEYDGYTRALAKEKGAERRELLKKPTPQLAAKENYLGCKLAEVATGGSGIAGGMGVSDFKMIYRAYSVYVLSRPSRAQIGYFAVNAEGGNAVKAVGTGNRYAEPKQWDGSRFFIVDASFKNMDTESRLPIEGSLYITYNGKEYEFDSVEAVMLEGYNIWFKKVNPLITMKTKIVYRIPDEIEGDVFWKPGRNPDDTRLWVGSVKAQQ